MHIAAGFPGGVKSFFKNNVLIAVFVLVASGLLWLFLLPIPKKYSKAACDRCRENLDKVIGERSERKLRWIRFSINFLVGVLILLLLHIFDDLKQVREFEDWGADLYIKLTVNTTPEKPGIPYAYLNFDQESFKQWQEPFFTPRDKLRTLIEKAIAGEAKAVVVDIELRREGDQHYDELVASLARYDQRCTQANQEDGLSCPPVILVRTFDVDDGSKHLPKVKAVPPALEQLVADAKHIYWASTLFDRSKDHLVRYWNLWLPACDEDGAVQVVPSVQLLAPLLAASEQPRQSYDELMARLHKLAPASCTQSTEEAHKKQQPEFIQLGDSQIHFGQEHISKRVFYSIPPEGGTALTLDDRALVNVVPAYRLTDAGGSSLALIKDRIAMIGASHKESGDLHITPLGEMAGSMVLINSMQSLQQYGDVVAPHGLLTWLIQLALIAFISTLFAFSYDHAAGKSVAGLQKKKKKEQKEQAKRRFTLSEIDSSWVGVIGFVAMILLLPVSMWLIG